MRKKPSQTQAASDLAKLAKIGPPPSFSFASSLSAQIETIMGNKLEKALLLWAFHQMGRHFKKYLDQAHRNFWTLVYLDVMLNKKDLISALKEAPYAFPLKPTPKQPSAFDAFQFQKEYDQLLPKVQDAKNKTRHVPTAQKMALAQALGITNKKTIEKYLEMKASDIALDHLRSKHGVWTINIEMIQKHLSLVRHPEKMEKQLIKTIAKEAGVKLA
jgi:hypothetical protein